MAKTNNFTIPEILEKGFTVFIKEVKKGTIRRATVIKHLGNQRYKCLMSKEYVEVLRNKGTEKGFFSTSKETEVPCYSAVQTKDEKAYSGLILQNETGYYVSRGSVDIPVTRIEGTFWWKEL